MKVDPFRLRLDVASSRKKSPEGVNLIASYTKLDPTVVAKIAVPDFPLTVDVRSIEETARLMVRHGLIKNVPDIQSIIYTPKP